MYTMKLKKTHKNLQFQKKKKWFDHNFKFS